MHNASVPFEGFADTGHPVWDRFLRLFHWALAASIVTALVTGFLLDASWSRLHLVSGVFAVSLVAARIIWGFTGPTYARFSQFVPTPRAVMTHLRGGETHARHLGHNPLGALMVLALLATVLTLGVTGTALLGSALKTGPVAFALPATQGRLWSELHEMTAFGILGLAISHLAGVIFESWRGGENLSRAMITGRKEVRQGDLVARPRAAHVLSALALIAGLAFAGTASITGLTRIAPDRQPVATLPETYVTECTACHMAYHPSLRSAASWTLMMDQLDSHFGEDASLPDTARDDITAWLAQHAAGTVDSKPAMLWRDLSETKSVSLPETSRWKWLHGGLDDSVFQRRPIHSRANCGACHQDAETGWFSPFNLSIPKETTK